MEAGQQLEVSVSFFLRRKWNILLLLLILWFLVLRSASFDSLFSCLLNPVILASCYITCFYSERRWTSTTSSPHSFMLSLLRWSNTRWWERDVLSNRSSGRETRNMNEKEGNNVIKVITRRTGRCTSKTKRGTKRRIQQHPNKQKQELKVKKRKRTWDQ